MRSAQINKWKWKSSHAPETQSKTDSLLFLIRGKWIALRAPNIDDETPTTQYSRIIFGVYLYEIANN